MASERMSNAEVRQAIEALVRAETRIGAAVIKIEATRWRWVDKPSTHVPPHMWNDIVVVYENGSEERYMAAEFVDLVEDI